MNKFLVSDSRETLEKAIPTLESLIRTHYRAAGFPIWEVKAEVKQTTMLKTPNHRTFTHDYVEYAKTSGKKYGYEVSVDIDTSG